MSKRERDTPEIEKLDKRSKSSDEDNEKTPSLWERIFGVTEKKFLFVECKDFVLHIETNNKIIDIPAANIQYVSLKKETSKESALTYVFLKSKTCIIIDGNYSKKISDAFWKSGD